MTSRTACLAALCAIVLAAHTAEAYVHTQVTSMSKDCQTRYADLLASIPEPFDPEDEANCHDVIVNATDNTSGVGCPTADTLIACFQINQTAWRSLVNDCDLVSPAPNCLSGGVADAKYGNDCQRPRQSNSYWLTSITEGKYAIERYDFDTGIVPNAGSDWRTVQGEGARRLLATPYLTYSARRRRALLQGESEGGGAGQSAGCFPDIYTGQDFENWLEGSYIEPTFGGNTINPIGIIFWIVHFFGVLSMAAF